MNVTLVVFNMIPAFLMDGGRVPLAALAMRFEYSQATQIASTVGQFIAIAFGAIGLFFNLFLLFIALFVFLGAQQEAHATAMRPAMAGVPVRDAMITEFRTLRGDETLGHAVKAPRQGRQQDFRALDGDDVVGLLTRDDMFRALGVGAHDHHIADYMRRDCLKVGDDEVRAEVLRQMTENQRSSLAVLNGGRLVGPLTLEHVGELMQIDAARRQRRCCARPMD